MMDFPLRDFDDLDDVFYSKHRISNAFLLAKVEGRLKKRNTK